ncbi:hypothetical protein C1752_16969 [Acaryochloris thomasi RCC1774]|uniref:Uncharacterized protein n=1 Tax=Acaryochloris thomasi RCC1774 TaxID=1764569 RepID=A0A2W1J7I1_9CYAN|nr:hypothetical protein [Acaryochloris thomasi]PZD70198.1 hypothetical protein C1752_16969 [Acaryochloris thomasi RCC1774]
MFSYDTSYETNFAGEIKIPDKIGIKKYTNLCRILKRELSQVIEDREEEHFEYVYAVDFSEIYAYVFREKTAKEFSIFQDIPDSVALALQYNALHFLFHQSKRCILLQSYEKEWDFLLSNLSKEELSKILSSDYEIAKELKYLQENSTFQDLLKRTDNSKDLNDSEFNKAWEFLTEHSSTLLGVFLQHSLPLQRLMNLTSDELFQDATSFIQNYDSSFNFSHEEKVSEPVLRRYKKLITLRRHESSSNSCYLDAIALGTIDKMNQVLSQRQIKIVLVTRSEAMHRLSESEHPKKKPSLSSLRHPRIFLDFYRRTTTDELKEHLYTVTNFIESSNKASRRKEEGELEVHDFLKKNFEKLQNIRKFWINAATIVDVSKSEQYDAHSRSIIPTDRPSQLSVHRLMKFIRNNEDLGHRLEVRVDNIADEWKKAHHTLGVSLQAVTASSKSNLDIQVVSSDTKHELHSKKAISLYSLHFYSNEAKKFIEDYSKVLSVQWWEILDSFNTQKDLSSDAKYERILALSFVLSTLGEWKLAKRYCELALTSSPKNMTFVYPSEGFYFLSICVRKTNYSVLGLRESLRLIDRAIDLRRKHIDSDESRYYLERGNQTLILNCLLSADDINREPDFRFPYAENGFSDLLKAEKLAFNDPVLISQIVVYRLNYYIESKQYTYHIQEIERDIRRLVECQKRIHNHVKDWPIIILDTVVWSYWIINSNNSSKDWLQDKDWVSYLNYLRLSTATQSDLTGREKAMVEMHLQKIFNISAL